MAVLSAQAGSTQLPVNRNGQVVIVTVAFELTCIVFCLFARLYMRWPWRKLLARNDWMAIVATVSLSILARRNTLLTIHANRHSRSAMPLLCP